MLRKQIAHHAQKSRRRSLPRALLDRRGLYATRRAARAPVVARARAAAALPVVAASPLRPQVAVSRTSVSGAQMGLFGLGWAEIGVIGLIALFFFGPDKLMPIAKDLGARESFFFN